MKLILVRHAEAAAKGEMEGTTDADRPLTDRGREQAAKLAEAFLAHGVTPDAVVTSPLARAVQTAEPLLPLLPGTAKDPVVTDLLSPDGYRPKRLTKELTDAGGEVVLAVGHNPSLSDYLCWLLGVEAAVELEKGAAALVEFADGVEKGAGRLGWLVTPGWYLNVVAPVGG